MKSDPYTQGRKCSIWITRSPWSHTMESGSYQAINEEWRKRNCPKNIATVKKVISKMDTGTWEVKNKNNQIAIHYTLFNRNILEFSQIHVLFCAGTKDGQVLPSTLLKYALHCVSCCPTRPILQLCSALGGWLIWITTTLFLWLLFGFNQWATLSIDWKLERK